ncbi:MAG: MFS transporter, partial [Xanthobacteraceae bacterium]
MSLAARHNEGADSAYAWLRLVAAILLATIGGVGMWSFPVALPAIQADFSIIRADASLPFTLAMLGFAAGGAVMGWLLDRFGILVPLTCGVVALAVGYVAAGNAVNLWWFAVAHGLIGIGSSASLGPLMADMSQWFVRRRGIAVALCSAGNYLAGVVWPPLVQHFIASAGWRPTHIGIGLFCAATMLPLAWLALRRAPPVHQIGVAAAAAARAQSTLGLSPNALMALLSIAGIGCCVAMSMPQVHIVAYCSDLGFGAARGAEMLSVMLAAGIASRLISGWISDHVGGLRTLLLGSVLQGIALLAFLFTNGV